MFGLTDVGSMRPHDDVKCQDTLVFDGDHLTPAEELALVEEGLELLAQKDRLTHTEVFALANMVGGADVVRQVLRGERVIKTVLINPTRGAILEDELGEPILEEVGDLLEAPAVKSFCVREKFVVASGELDTVSISCDAEAFWEIEETDVPASVYKRRMLLKRSIDTRILATLDLARIWDQSIAAAHLYWLLQTEPRFDFHCFVDVADRPLSIHVWHDDGRHLEVLRVPYPRQFERGDITITP
jgi:hypothetical protein